MKKRYPVKQDLNLAQYDAAHRRKVRTVILIVLIAAIVLAALLKFAVFDRFAALKRAELAADTAESQLAQAQAATAGYDELTRQHEMLTFIYRTVEYEIDPLEALVLPETHLVGRAHVSTLFVGEEIISVQFSGLTLEEISGIYSRLMEHELVKNVQVFTASTKGDSNAETGSSDQVTASMTIHLTPGEEAEAQ